MTIIFIANILEMQINNYLSDNYNTKALFVAIFCFEMHICLRFNAALTSAMKYPL